MLMPLPKLTLKETISLTLQQVANQIDWSIDVDPLHWLRYVRMVDNLRFKNQARKIFPKGITLLTLQQSAYWMAGQFLYEVSSGIPSQVIPDDLNDADRIVFLRVVSIYKLCPFYSQGWDGVYQLQTLTREPVALPMETKEGLASYGTAPHKPSSDGFVEMDGIMHYSRVGGFRWVRIEKTEPEE